MKLTFKEKAKLFWERNKTDILGWLIGAGVIAGAGCVAVHMNQKSRERHEAKLAEDIRKLNEEIAKKQAEAEAEDIRKLNEEIAKKQAEAEAEEERIKNDPANQIAGGYVRPENDDLTNKEYPNILVNTVPVANMGELGQEVVQWLNEEWFGEFGETGEAHPFDPATATVDVMIDFGHEVWKRNNPEGIESQEKQSA